MSAQENTTNLGRDWIPSTRDLLIGGRFELGDGEVH